jgi:16S rRNA (uracil1498-N3)-methyltransferase
MGLVPFETAARAHVVLADLLLGGQTHDEAREAGEAGVLLPAADYHHLARVLRLRAGEVVTLTNGEGAWLTCEVPPAWDSPVVPLMATSAVRVVARPEMRTVAFALVKNDKPETVIQKLTELGVGRIVLLAADHSVVKWDAAKATKNLERLATVAREALMQSRGVWLPKIEGPVTLAAFVAAESAHGRQVFAADLGGTSWHGDIRCVAIGPEGGWSRAEREIFPKAPVSLSRHTVLRAETAAITAGVLLTDESNRL